MKVFTKLLNNAKISSELIVKKVNGKAKPIDYFQYSTEEQFTGKYWLDGKMIYCKGFSGTYSDVNTGLNKVKVSQLLYAIGNGVSSYANATYVGGGLNNEIGYHWTVYQPPGSYLALQNGGYYDDNRPISVVVFYTK